MGGAWRRTKKILKVTLSKMRREKKKKKAWGMELEFISSEKGDI